MSPPAPPSAGAMRLLKFAVRQRPGKWGRSVAFVHPNQSPFITSALNSDGTANCTLLLNECRAPMLDQLHCYKGKTAHPPLSAKSWDKSRGCGAGLCQTVAEFFCERLDVRVSKIVS